MRLITPLGWIEQLVTELQLNDECSRHISNTVHIFYIISVSAITELQQ